MKPTSFPRRLVQALSMRSSIDRDPGQSYINKRARATRQVRAHRPLGDCLESRVVLSTFKVNSLLDTVAVNLKSGKDASGQITLRSAIMAADAKGGSNTIKVPSGTITLTIA